MFCYLTTHEYALGLLVNVLRKNIFNCEYRLHNDVKNTLALVCVSVYAIMSILITTAFDNVVLKLCLYC